MELKTAERADIEGTLKLQHKYHIDSIKEEDKKDGFVTTPFTREQLENLIDKEQGLFVAKSNGEVVAYAMAASWGYWSTWPLFSYMINNLSNVPYLGQVLTTKNSFQYGPICIDKPLRGSGVLEKLFAVMKEKMSQRYPILVTFVNKNNPRSYAAHSRKLGLELLQEFEFNNNCYYELVCTIRSSR